MKKITFLFSVVTLTIGCITFVNAQTTLNIENLSKPEVELIIGLNHPKNNNDIKLQLQNNNVKGDTDDTSTGMNGIMLGNNDGDLEDDILNEYLDNLGDETNGLPEKEELVLERLKNPQDNVVSIYPNPAVNFINVKVEELQNFEIEVYDFIGNMVIAEKVNHIENTKHRVDVSNLQNGVYLMYIVTNTDRIIKKFGVN